ncbi:hypothetical protein Q5P01_014408 [Channa striata]|uniref:Uncharacterized protein n=1 Tax=Channa striata TaxID=64152 RepID=A0AA88MFD6_CHASR|nr:hypothetical protein Q5P01_014408 [Channa striata]
METEGNRDTKVDAVKAEEDPAVAFNTDSHLNPDYRAFGVYLVPAEKGNRLRVVSWAATVRLGWRTINCDCCCRCWCV